MSGKRQHIIPRFLLRGFAASDRNKKKDKSKLWVYDRRKDLPYHSTEENVAVENKFYVHDNMEADTAITTHEGKWAKLVNDLRNENVSALTSPDIPYLLWHLEIRSKNFRQGFTSACQKMVIGILDGTLNFESADRNRDLREYLIEDIYNEVGTDIEQLVSILDIPAVARRAGLTNDHIDKISSPKDLLFFLVMYCYLPALRQDKAWQVEIKKLEDRLCRSEIPEVSRFGHIRALRKAYNKSSEIDVSFYTQLKYKILHFPNNSVILGDAPVMRLTKDGKYDKKLSKINNMAAVALPLSSNQVLVGHIAETEQNINIQAFKEAVARSSEDFFVGSCNSNENRKLHEIIGTESDLISADELNSMIASIPALLSKMVGEKTKPD